MAEFALRPLSLGELLDRAFTIFRRRFGAILLVMVVCLILPSLMLLNNVRTFTEFAQLARPGGDPQAQAQLVFTLFAKIAWVALVFAVALVIARTALGWITHKAMLGEATDVTTALTHGIKLFFPMLGLLIVEGVILVIVEIVLYIPMVVLGVGAVAAAGRSGPGAGFGIGVLLFMVVYAVAILYVVASLFVTTSALLAEADTGVFQAIERSWTLTKGRRWNIVGALALVYLLLWVVMVAVSFIVGIGLGLAQRGPEAGGGMLAAFLGGMLLFSLLVSGYYFVLQMVTYYDLRVRKEGLDLELASAAMPPA